MATRMEFQLSMPDAQTEVRQLRRSVLAATVHRLQHVFEQATAEDLRRTDLIFAEATEEAAPEADPDRRALLARLTDGREFSPVERVALEANNLDRLFALRRTVLEDALTAPGAARLLGTSRQTPYDRAKRGTLLAVLDRGALRFPQWQFDPAGPGGVVADLPAVLAALRVSALEKALWLTRPSPLFAGRTPFDILQSGETARVLDAAAAVGVS